MKVYSIWAEGYMMNSERGDATLLGQEMADSFDEAIEKLNKRKFEGQRDKIEPYTRKSFGSEEAWLNRRSNWKYWGCAVFDNERDARKSFG